MIYRLTSGPWAGLVTTDKEYQSRNFSEKCLFEPITEIGSYPHSLWVTEKTGELKIQQFIFDIEPEVTEFVKQSGFFTVPQFTSLALFMLSNQSQFTIETSKHTIKYIRKYENRKPTG